jgi:hypothetical protein
MRPSDFRKKIPAGLTPQAVAAFRSQVAAPIQVPLTETVLASRFRPKIAAPSPGTHGVDARIALRLKRALGLTTAPGLEAGPLVQPTYEVSDRTRILYDGITRGIVIESRAAAGGNKAFIGLANPKGSGIIVLLEAARCRCSVAGDLTLTLAQGTTNALTFAGVVPIDRGGMFARRAVQSVPFKSDNVGGAPSGGGSVGNGFLMYEPGVAANVQTDALVSPDDSLVCTLYPDDMAYFTGTLVGLLFGTFCFSEHPLIP